MKRKIHVECSDLEWLYSQDWEYWDYGYCQRHLQMILPYRRAWNEDEKYPLILFIPGSSWHKQEMYNDIPKLAELAKRGFAVAVLEYRESDIARFPAQVEDVANAFEFIGTKAEQFHFDMNRLFLMGNSSGGHIATMAVLLNAHGLCKPLPKLRGVINECGSTDLLICAKNPLPPWMKVRPSAVLLGVETLEGNEELARQASAGMYITKDVKIPPMCILHSDGDPIVSVENSRVLNDLLEKNGHKVEYYELENNDSHCGATYFCDAVLDIVANFCQNNYGGNSVCCDKI